MNVLSFRKLKKLNVISFNRNTRCILLRFHIMNDKMHSMIQEISPQVSASTVVFYLHFFFIPFEISKCLHFQKYKQYLLYGILFTVLVSYIVHCEGGIQQVAEHFIQNQCVMGNENKTQKACNFCILKRYNSMLFIILIQKLAAIWSYEIECSFFQEAAPVNSI